MIAKVSSTVLRGGAGSNPQTLPDTSKTCTRCGHVHTRLGGSKVFHCPSCGFTRFAGLEWRFRDLPESFAGYRLYHFYR